MQAEIIFTENTIGTKVANLPKIFQAIKPLQGLRQLIKERCWDERLLACEKHINRFSWIIIIATVVYLAPVCISIFNR
ncbi:MAG: hypothetical protein CVU52_03210 [Deltaproteobacteria bacterium HGW-Deltaproteobacteria-10]|nr:MAG: hypothetical protein CVU52_03210 [Deltaproteobacteria bacterium HGW-Deltaproteobacteria-10]